MKEIWKDVIGFEGFYQVSNLGRVKKLECITNFGRNKKRWPERIVQPTKDTNYEFIRLGNKDKVWRTSVHRLVAIHFIPNPDNLPQVNHKDENGHNNHVDNLEWCTAKYNCNYGTRNERCQQRSINSGWKIKKYKYLTPEGTVVEMTKGPASRWHSDWKLIKE